MLYIIANTGYFLTAFVMERLDGAPGVRVLAHDSRRRGAMKSLAKLAEASLPWALSRSRYFSEAYLAQLHAIAPQDSVLIFGVENLKELTIVLRHIRTRHCTLFTWNPVCDYQQNPWLRARHLAALRRLGPEVVTFDPQDARTYGLRLVDQVYRAVGQDSSAWQNPSPACDLDLYFVGQDKGRLAQLMTLQAAAGQAGLRCLFHTTPDKHRRYGVQEIAWLQDKPLSYADNLAHIARARALVEIAQPGQSGPTVRSLEAAFFNKKLLTTRALARQDALYDSARVLVLEQGQPPSPAALAAFIAADHRPPEAATLARHDMLHWCQQFAQGE